MSATKTTTTTQTGEPGIFSAFIAAQGELRPVASDKVNPHFRSRYASFAAIAAEATRVLKAHGLGFRQSIEDGQMHTQIVNAAGECLVSSVPFSAANTTPQGIGSAITYAKRYGLLLALGLPVVDDETDDDGNRAQGTPAPARREVPDV